MRIKICWDHGITDDESPTSLCEGPGLLPEQTMWDLWWTMRHWGRLVGFSRSFSLPQTISFYHYPILTYVSPGKSMGLLAAMVPVRHSLTPSLQ